MRKKAYDFYDVLQPLRAVTKWFDLSIGSAVGEVGSSERRYVFTKKDQIWNIFVAVVLALICGVHYNLCPDSFNEIQLFIFVLLKYCNYTTIFVLFSITNFYKRRVLVIIKDLKEVAEKIENTTEIGFDYEKCRKYLIGCLLFCYQVLLLQVGLVVIGSSNDNLFADREVQCGSVSIFVITMTIHRSCLLFILLYGLKLGFSNINEYLAKSVKIKPHLNVRTKLNQLSNIYRKLLDISKEINAVSKEVLLCKIIVSAGYILIMTFLINSQSFKGKSLHLSMYLGLIFWNFAFLLEVVFTIHHFDSLRDEAKKTVHLMEDVQTAVGKSNLAYKQVELFSLQVYVENFEFNIFGFFPLDWTLLHSMLAGIATYLVIFHQFSNMEKNTDKKMESQFVESS